MLGKKEFTLSEIEKMEAEKKDRLEKISTEILALQNGRDAILLRMADEDMTAFGDLEKCDAAIAKLSNESDAIHLFLKTIPGRKNYVRGTEIKARLPLVKKATAGIQPLVEDVLKKAAALASANQALRAYLEKFGEFPETKAIGLGADLLSRGIGAIPRMAHPAMGDEGHNNTSAVIFGILALADGELDAWLDGAQKEIDTRLERAEHHARKLQGEDVPDMKWHYCPYCYALSDGRPGHPCSKCGKAFPAGNAS